MTLSQLRTFALVVKLGSLHAAAAILGVSEPAVSSALAALRRDLGDPLYVRAAGGIALTPGGRALAVHAQEIVGIADQARREVSHAQSSSVGLRVLATAAFAEHAAGRLLDAFTRRVPGLSLDVVVEPAEDVAALLAEHAYDIALGVRPPSSSSQSMDVVPVLRYHRVLVAAARHRLATRGGAVTETNLLGCTWFAGPTGIEEATEEGRWIARLSGIPAVVQLSSETDALAAVRAGEGIMLALSHNARAEIENGTLMRLPLAGTPISGLWWASTLGQERAAPAAQALQRFATTAEATAAMLAPGGSRGLARRGSQVRVALWS